MSQPATRPWRWLGFACGLFGLTLTLGACVDGGGGPATGSEAAEPASEAGAAAADLAALPPAETEPVFNEDPQDLMGLNGASVATILGTPTLLRLDAPARIWQYRGAECVFDVFLYDEGEAERVTYIEARDGQGQEIAAKPCYNAILKERAEAQSS